MWEWPVRATVPPSGSGAMAASRSARSARASRTTAGQAASGRLQVDREQRVLDRRLEKPAPALVLHHPGGFGREAQVVPERLGLTVDGLEPGIAEPGALAAERRLVHGRGNAGELERRGRAARARRPAAGIAARGCCASMPAQGSPSIESSPSRCRMSNATWRVALGGSGRERGLGPDEQRRAGLPEALVGHGRPVPVESVLARGGVVRRPRLPSPDRPPADDRPRPHRVDLRPDDALVHGEPPVGHPIAARARLGHPRFSRATMPGRCSTTTS